MRRYKDEEIREIMARNWRQQMDQERAREIALLDAEWLASQARPNSPLVTQRQELVSVIKWAPA